VTPTYISGNQTITLSGDVSGSGTTGINVVLNTVATPGTYNNVTVNAKGLVTSGSSVSYLTSHAIATATDVVLTSLANNQLLQYNSTSSKWVNWTPNYITGNQNITISGDASGSGTTSIGLTLAATGVIAGTYGSSSNIPVVTVDLKGRVTSISTQAVTIVSALSGLTDVLLTSVATGQLLQYNGTRWVNWSPNYITGNQSISFSATGDVTGSSSGTTALATTLTLATVNSNIGTFNNVTVNAKGLVTAASNVSYLTSYTETDPIFVAFRDTARATSTVWAGPVSGSAAPTWRQLALADISGSNTLAPLASPALTGTPTAPTAAPGTNTTQLATTAFVQAALTAAGAITNLDSLTDVVITTAATGQLLRFDGTNWVNWTPNYLTGNQSITFTASGDVTASASGTTSLTPTFTLATVNSNVGTFNNVTVNAKGLVTAATSVSYQAPITVTTTGISGASTFVGNVLNIPNHTLAGLGGQPLDADLTAISALTGTGLARRTGVDTWTLDTSVYLTSITSSQVTTALGYTPENPANKGVANGYASLGSDGKVHSTQLPSYVDDVLEYLNQASFPVTGETGKIYVDLATNKIYRWSGSVYIEISPAVGTVWGGITGTLANQTDLQNALNAKEPTITAGTTAQYWRGDKSWQTLPVYTLAGLGGVPTTRTLTINGTAFDLSADRSWTISSASSLATLTDATITSPSNGQLLQYNSTTSKWVNWSPNYITGNQTITLSGDVSGSGTTSISTTLATVTQSTGSSFVKITLDTKGRVTGNSAVGSGDITGALGYTPYNSTNPSGYTTNTGTVTSIAFTSGNGLTTSGGPITSSGTITIGSTGDNVRINSLGVGMAASATTGRIDASGDIIGFNTSDERLKRDIKVIENATDLLSQIRGVEYYWDESKEYIHGFEGLDYGVVAQEVEKIFPTMVRLRETGFLSVRYEKLIGVLVAAVNEQNVRIKNLEMQLGK
jgi:hypothetical protein